MLLLCAALQIETEKSRCPQLDEAWFPRIAAGDQEAFCLLYKATAPALYGYLLSLMKQPQEAEDLLQDTYLKVRANAHRYQPQGKPLAWLLTIGKNLALMRLRSQSKTASLPQTEPAAPSGDTEDLLDRLVLAGALQALDGMERQIVVLHAVAGFKHRELAAFLELPLPSVLSKYARALKKLKRYLTERECRDENKTN